MFYQNNVSFGEEYLAQIFTNRAHAEKKIRTQTETMLRMMESSEEHINDVADTDREWYKKVYRSLEGKYQLWKAARIVSYELVEVEETLK